MKNNNSWSKIKHWIDVAIFVLVVAILIARWTPEIDSKQIHPSALWDAVTTLTKDTIQTGIIATSILLPASIVVLGFLYHVSQTSTKKQNSIKDISTYFLHASVFFVISLGLALLNMTHLPLRLEWEVDISRNSIIFVLAVGQYASLFLGIWKILLGGICIRRIIP